jgi:DNA-binding NarL/FixJ family response regulator
MAPLEPQPGYLLSDDLIFASRISGTAHDLGFRVIALRSADDLRDAVHAHCPRCVIVDLANPGLVIADLMKNLAHVAPRPFVVAYGSHVDAKTLQAARDAGCDVVWPRSKFVAELAAAIPHWFGKPDPREAPKPQGESSSPGG